MEKIKTKIMDDLNVILYRKLKGILGEDVMLGFCGRYTAALICENIDIIFKFCDYAIKNKVDLKGITYEDYINMLEKAQKKEDDKDD